jgi:hypothetical protein
MKYREWGGAGQVKATYSWHLTEEVKVRLGVRVRVRVELEVSGKTHLFLVEVRD